MHYSYGLSFARKGTAVVLSALLAGGALPAVSFAEEADSDNDALVLLNTGGSVGTNIVTYYVVASGNENTSISQTVEVVESEEGGYDITLTVPASLYSSVSVFYLYGVDGNEIEASLDEEGNASFTLHADNLIDNLYFSMAYEVAYGGTNMTMSHDMALVWPGTTYDGSSVEDEDEETGTTTSDNFVMVVGQEYTLPVSFLNSSGSGATSMAGSYMESSATVVYNEDGTYSVTVATTSSDYISGISYNGTAATQDGLTFTISGVTSIANDILISMTVAMMSGQTVDALISLDTSSLETTGDNDDTSGDATDNTPTADGVVNTETSSDGEDTTTATQSALFVAGHTYEVPIAILKENSTETSMAAQYFGNTAYVRVLEDGTMSVSFSTNRSDYVTGITYEGAAVSQSGSTFTLTIPYSESDVVLTLGLTIAPMEALGMDEVSADLHLYLTQAVDLGTDVTADPSSTYTATLAQTGDETATGAVAVLALAAAGMAAIAGTNVLRDRRREQ